MVLSLLRRYVFFPTGTWPQLQYGIDLLHHVNGCGIVGLELVLLKTGRGLEDRRETRNYNKPPSHQSY